MSFVSLIARQLYLCASHNEIISEHLWSNHRFYLLPKHLLALFVLSILHQQSTIYLSRALKAWVLFKLLTSIKKILGNDQWRAGGCLKHCEKRLTLK